MVRAAQGKDAQLPTVLVVDDERRCGWSAASISSSTATACSRRRTSPRPSRFVAADSVDLVLLDVHIGADTGIALMRSLREREHRAPVVLVTGSARLDAETIAEADGVVAKPFRLEQLLEVVRRLTAA